MKYFFAWTLGLRGPVPGVWDANGLADINGRSIPTIGPLIEISESEFQTANLKVLAERFPCQTDQKP